MPWAASAGPGSLSVDPSGFFSQNNMIQITLLLEFSCTVKFDSCAGKLPSLRLDLHHEFATSLSRFYR